MSEQYDAVTTEANFRRKVITWPAIARPAAKFNAKDALYAIAAIAIISGFNIGATKIPYFSLIVPILCWLDRRSFTSKISPIFFLPPLVIFTLIHLGSSFLGGIGLGLFFIAQFAIIFSFTWLFVVRYSSFDMSLFKLYFSITLALLLAYVIWWHVSQGYMVGWKRLPDPKAIFSLLPLMLVLTTRSHSAFIRRSTPILLVAVAAIIFLSGERKAYFLLLMFLPLLISLRNPATYVVPLVVILFIPVAAALDPTGYLKRQVASVEGFTQGRVVNTISNEDRSDALRMAFQTIREHPILGVGTTEQLAIAREINRNAAGPHNEWVRVAAENGVIGLFFYAATVIWGLGCTLRPRVLGRYRSRAEREAAFAFALVLIMYISFEAFDFIVLLAFLMIPFIQYLRLTPQVPDPAPPAHQVTGQAFRRRGLRPARS